MNSVISYLRIKEWLSSKVTMMMGIFAYFLYINETDYTKALVGMGVYFLFVSAFLAISYIANDYSDIEVDHKAGKQKIIAGMKKWQIWLSFIILFISGNGLLFVFCDNILLTLVLVFFTYVLGLAYSTLKIRFKEKGIWGLIECSFAQRCMPLAIICVMIPIEPTHVCYMAGWMLISFFDGLRYIIIHQFMDMENDLKSGVVTYVTQKKKNYRRLLISLFVIETAGALALLFPIMQEHIITSAVVIIVFVLLELGIYEVLNVFAKKDWFCTFDSVPCEAFLNCGIPLIVGICCMLSDWHWSIFVLFIMAVCYKPILIKWNISKIFYFRKN